MKLSVDTKFLATTGLTFVLLVAVVVILQYAVGIAAATVVGGVLGAVSIKLFDKLDYNPTFDLEFGAPKISAPWIYSLLAAVFIIYGCSIAAEAARSLYQRLAPDAFPCRISEPVNENETLSGLSLL